MREGVKGSEKTNVLLAPNLTLSTVHCPLSTVHLFSFLVGFDVNVSFSFSLTLIVVNCSLMFLFLDVNFFFFLTLIVVNCSLIFLFNGEFCEFYEATQVNYWLITRTMVSDLVELRLRRSAGFCGVRVVGL